MALKISANSVYGFTGAQVGKLPCLEISQVSTLLVLKSNCRFGRKENKFFVVENDFGIILLFTRDTSDCTVCVVVNSLYMFTYFNLQLLPSTSGLENYFLNKNLNLLRHPNGELLHCIVLVKIHF